MNPEVKDLWVKALRSGEYSQAEGKLCYASKEDGSRSFCCLGVLADLGVKAGVIPDWVGDTPEASTLGIRLGGTANYSDLNGLIPMATSTTRSRPSTRTTNGSGRSTRSPTGSRLTCDRVGSLRALHGARA
jgi:hypothetical protein